MLKTQKLRLKLPYYIIYFIFFFVNGAIEKAFPLYLTEFGISGKLYGSIFSIISASQIFLPYIVGNLSEKLNPSKITIFSIIVTILSYVFLLNNSNLYILILLGILTYSVRVIFNYSLGNNILINVKSENRSQYISIRDIFLFSGMSLGIFIYSQLNKYKSIAYTSKYWSYLYILVIIYIIIYFLNDIKLFDKKEKGLNKSVFNIFSVLKNKVVSSYIIINIILNFSDACQKFIPVLAISIGVESDIFLRYSSIFILLNSIIAYFLSEKLENKNRKKIFVIDIFMDLVPYLLFALTNNKYIFIFGMFILQMKDVLLPISFSYTLDLFDEGTELKVLGFSSTVSNLVNIVAPIIIGFTWDIYSGKIFIIGAIFVLISGIIAIRTMPEL